MRTSHSKQNLQRDRIPGTPQQPSTAHPTPLPLCPLIASLLQLSHKAADQLVLLVGLRGAPLTVAARVERTLHALEGLVSGQAGGVRVCRVGGWERVSQGCAGGQVEAKQHCTQPS